MTTTVEAAKASRPVWQTEPCPRWCEPETHADGDFDEDRNHIGAVLEVPMRLARAVKMTDGAWEIATWKMYLRQSQGGAPCLHMFNDDYEHQWIEFCPDEAQQLVENVQLVLGQIAVSR